LAESQSDEDLKKYYDYNDKTREYRRERAKKFNVITSGWSDGTGKMYMLQEFESFEAYAKFMDDEEYQRMMVHAWRNVKNGKVKVLRKQISAPPKS
jgi:uncharacterized protein (DUF1330 family)